MPFIHMRRIFGKVSSDFIRLMRWIRDELLSDGWSRFALACVLLSIYNAYRLALHIPGVYIAVLGLVAAGVAMRENPSRTEKALWIVALTFLMFAEMKNLYVAENQHTQELIGTVSQITGGNSFRYLLPWRISDEGTGFAVMAEGRYLLYDVDFYVVDARVIIKSLPAGDVLSKRIGNIGPPGAAVPLQERVPFQISGDQQALNVSFSARNGWWTQLLRLEKVNGQWEHANLVIKMGRPQGTVLMRDVSKGFPLQTLASDADWQAQAKLPQAAN